MVAVIATVGMILASCAKAEPEDTKVLEKLAFDAWVLKHINKNVANSVAQEQTNGMYVEFLDDGDQSVEFRRDTIVWLRLNYTATDIQNNVYVTRDSLQALKQHTFTPYTYYVPDYLYTSETNYGMFEGQFFALREELKKPDGSTFKMTQGSRVRLYVPSYLAYGSNGFSNDQGYGGQYSLGETKIIIHDLTIEEVISDPVKKEEQLVADLAGVDWGLAEKDTIAKHFYVDTLNFTPRAHLLEKFPVTPAEKCTDADTLGLESTAKIWFIGKFLPSKQYPKGFIFDTNIETVYDEFYNRRENENYKATAKTFGVLSYTPSSDEKDYISAFHKAIPSLRRGQWSRLVFTSAYGYGVTGLSKNLQDQQAYYDAYMSMYAQSMMYGNYGGYGGYGGGYGGGYYNNYYDNYYYGGYGGYGGAYDYYDYSPSYYSETKTEQQIITEIQPYTPLVFEIYIESGTKD